MVKYSKYPQNLDDSTSMPVSIDGLTLVKSEVTNRLRDAIINIEQELGVSVSGTFTTVRARLDSLETSGVGGSGSGFISVQQDSSVINSEVDSINFTGGISIVNGAPHQIIVSVGGTTGQTQEILPVSNNQVLFTLTNSPVQSNAVEMYINGIKQAYGTDYTISNKTVNYLGSIALINTDILEFYYLNSIVSISTTTSNNIIYNVTAIKTTDYTAVINDLVRYDSTSGGFTITFPTAFGLAGQSIVVKNTNGSINLITIQAHGTETIDGSNTQTMGSSFKSLKFFSDGQNWMIIS